ncbi:MAG: lactate utilization protein [Desulfobacteraceae bacterium]|nr:lactate utilization protein [Desulfobacteraceae bacterium]
MVLGSDKDVKTVVKALKANRFAPVEFVEDGETAAKLVLDMIPLQATVRIPGSTTVRQIGLDERLRKRGTPVIDRSQPSDIPMHERRRLPHDILLTSSNALTLDGKLVNIDGTGGRVAPMIFGPKRVILVIGMNKLVRDVDEALDRIKNTIAPYHAKFEGRKPPCTVTGRCSDCKSPERICNITTIIEKKPLSTNIAIVLVGEDMGLGWNTSWPEERKEKICSVYRETFDAHLEVTFKGSS